MIDLDWVGVVESEGVTAGVTAGVTEGVTEGVTVERDRVCERASPETTCN